MNTGNAVEERRTVKNIPFDGFGDGVAIDIDDTAVIDIPSLA